MTNSSTSGLNGTSAVVIGGSTGIGRGVAEAWASGGSKVTVFSRSKPEGPGGDRLRWVRLDLRETQDVGPILESSLPEKVELACFSAIYYTDKRESFASVTERDWRDQVDVNLHGLWLTLKSTLPRLRKASPGLFLGISSEVVYNAGPGRSGYAATKAAGASLLNSVCQEEDPEYVRIVQAMPAGMVDSPGIRKRRPADFDYSDYMQPAAFGPVSLDLAATRGAGSVGASLVVQADGSYEDLAAGVPVSQSRPS